MILFLFLFGLALGAEPPSENNEVKQQLDDQAVKLLRGNCPRFWYNFKGRCYKYVATDMSWADAEFHCVSQGANLVSIHNLEEQIFVQSLIQNFDPARGPTWIGLSDIHKEGRWMWSDGSAARFFHWNTGEPNDYGGQEDCVVTSWGTQKKWNDLTCSHRNPSVCGTRP